MKKIRTNPVDISFKEELKNTVAKLDYGSNHDTMANLAHITEVCQLYFNILKNNNSPKKQKE